MQHNFRSHGSIQINGIFINITNGYGALGWSGLVLGGGNGQGEVHQGKTSKQKKLLVHIKRKKKQCYVIFVLIQCSLILLWIYFKL